VRAEPGDLATTPYRPATTVQGDEATIPDLVTRDLTASAPGVKLVGDTTYSDLAGWLYLATVIDCYSKAVVGWSNVRQPAH
jgi:putative transposase